VVALILTLVAAGSFLAALRITRVTDADRSRFLPPPVVAPSATPRPAPLAQVGAAALSRVVTIESQTDRGERFGTGWLLDAAGDFVTNAQDIAVVRSADGFAADPLPIAREADIPVPEPVVVLASARATEHGDTTSATLTARHQSITVRPDQGDTAAPVVYDDMLLIDGQVIYQGNSGGPVLDGGGRVVGIITAASPSAPEGFAVPIARVIDELRAFAARPSP
jgi:CBS domain-containing protein